MGLKIKPAEACKFDLVSLGECMPTGGITPEIIPHYLSLSSVVACAGSWLAPRELLKAGRFDSIAALIEQGKKLLDGTPAIAT